MYSYDGCHRLRMVGVVHFPRLAALYKPTSDQGSSELTGELVMKDIELSDRYKLDLLNFEGTSGHNILESADCHLIQTSSHFAEPLRAVRLEM